MMDAALQKELMEVRKMIAKAEPIKTSLGLPNGQHKTVPESITIEKAGKDKDGRAQVSIKWRCVEGPQKDISQMDYNGISETQIGYTKGKLLMLISDLDKDILKWQAQFDKFIETNTDVFVINVVTNSKKDKNGVVKQYKNVYVQGLADSNGDLGGGEVGGLEEVGITDELGELESETTDEFEDLKFD